MFDLYGTLVDVETDEISSDFWAQLSRDLTVDWGIVSNPASLGEAYNQFCVEEEARNGNGRILDNVFDRWLQEIDPLGNSKLTAPEFAAIFRRRSAKLRMRRYTVGLCKELRNAGVKLAIVSNTEALFTRVDLKDLGLAKYIDNIVLSSDLGVEKPNPEIITLALAPLEISTHSAVFIGDNWNTDIRGSLAANMISIYLTDNDRATLQLDNERHVISARPTDASIRNALIAADDLLR